MNVDDEGSELICGAGASVRSGPSGIRSGLGDVITSIKCSGISVLIGTNWSILVMSAEEEIPELGDDVCESARGSSCCSRMGVDDALTSTRGVDGKFKRWGLVVVSLVRHIRSDRRCCKTLTSDKFRIFVQSMQILQATSTQMNYILSK